MAVLSSQSLRRHRPVRPVVERTVHVESGTTYGVQGASVDVRSAQTVLLWPGRCKLLSTIEMLEVPTTMCGRVMDKSSLARKFITVQNTHIDPGFHGWLTLEVVNHSWKFVRIRYGQPIAQIVFEWLDQESDRPYAGKYQNQANRPVEAIAEAPPGELVPWGHPERPAWAQG